MGNNIKTMIKIIRLHLVVPTMLSVKADGSQRIIASQSQLLSATFTFTVGKLPKMILLCMEKEEEEGSWSRLCPTLSGGVRPTASVRDCTVTSPVWTLGRGTRDTETSVSVLET